MTLALFINVLIIIIIIIINTQFAVCGLGTLLTASECNATNVQGKNYNLHKLQGGGARAPELVTPLEATLLALHVHIKNVLKHDRNRV